MVSINKFVMQFFTLFRIKCRTQSYISEFSFEFQKFIIFFALIAVASAYVEHLSHPQESAHHDAISHDVPHQAPSNQYIPPQAPTNQYVPPSSPAQPAHHESVQHISGPAPAPAASFNQQDGYNYNNPTA